MPKPEQCFLSYAHTDHAAFERLRVHLMAMARLHGLHLWHDKRIGAGDYWNHRIQTEIERSQIFVLLMTADFFASDYIFLHEWPAIHARHIENGALVLPVIYRHCGWRGFFGDYIQVVPTTVDGHLRPIADWPRPENGFARAAEAITREVEDWFGINGSSPYATAGAPRP